MSDSSDDDDMFPSLSELSQRVQPSPGASSTACAKASADEVPPVVVVEKGGTGNGGEKDSNSATIVSASRSAAMEFPPCLNEGNHHVPGTLFWIPWTGGAKSFLPGYIMTQEEITAEPAINEVAGETIAVRFFPLQGLATAALVHKDGLVPLAWGSEESINRLEQSQKTNFLKKKLHGKKGFKKQTIPAVEKAVELARDYEVLRQERKAGEVLMLTTAEEEDSENMAKNAAGAAQEDSEDSEDEDGEYGEDGEGRAARGGERRPKRQKKKKAAQELLLVGDTIGFYDPSLVCSPAAWVQTMIVRIDDPDGEYPLGLANGMSLGEMMRLTVNCCNQNVCTHDVLTLYSNCTHTGLKWIVAREGDGSKTSHQPPRCVGGEKARPWRDAGAE
jgi:hypothetical protein